MMLSPEKWPTPTNEEQLRLFLGICGYFRHYIKRYCYLVTPLEKLCKNPFQKSHELKQSSTKTWEWNDSREYNFLNLKQTLMTTRVLSFPTTSGQFILDTDASHDEISAVLTQLQDGQQSLIAYASHKLSKSEL
jgi:hypothetical protein